MKFQTFDGDGVLLTNSWIDMASLDWSTDTNKATLTVPNNLAVGESLTVARTNILTEINTINAELSNKVDNFSVSASLAWS